MIGTFRYVIPFLEKNLEKNIAKLPASAEVDWFLTARYAKVIRDSGVTPLAFAKALLKHRRILPAVNELLESTRSEGTHVDFACAIAEQQAKESESSAAAATATTAVPATSSSTSGVQTTTASATSPNKPTQIIALPRDDYRKLVDLLKGGHSAFTLSRDAQEREVELRGDKAYLKGSDVQVVDYCAFAAEQKLELVQESRFGALVRKYGLPTQSGPLHFFEDKESGKMIIYDARTGTSSPRPAKP